MSIGKALLQIINVVHRVVLELPRVRGRRGTLEGIAITGLVRSGGFRKGSPGLVVRDIALTGVREQRKDCGHSVGGRRLAGGNGDQKFQEKIIDLSSTGLNNVDILPTNRFFHFHSGLAHGKFREQDICRGDSQNVADLLSQVRVGSSSNDTNIPDHCR